MALVLDRTPTAEGDLTNFCLHYILEEGAVPEEEQVCAYCETTWPQRLQTNVEPTPPISHAWWRGDGWSTTATQDVPTARVQKVNIWCNIQCT